MNLDPLNLSVADVEIDMGFICNHKQGVRIEFRRPPSVEVVTFLKSLSEAYGWEIEETDRSDKFAVQLRGDFYIKCTGASSDDVGNAIADKLSNDHGLDVRLSQFIDMKKPGCIRWTVGVDRLRLVHEKVD